MEHQVFIPDEPHVFIERLSNRVQKRFNYRVVRFKHRKDILKWSQQIFDLYNDAYAPLFGSTQLSQAQIDMYIKNFFGFVNKDFIKVVVDADNQVVAFGICMPSLSRSMQKAKGHLFPFGFLHIMKSINKNDILDMYLIGVSPEHQGKGINAIVMNALLKSAQKHHIKVAETGPELETNYRIQAQWKHFKTASTDADGLES